MSLESFSHKNPPRNVREAQLLKPEALSAMGRNGANAANENRRKRLEEEARFLEYDKGIREEEAKKLSEATNEETVPFNEDDQN